MSDETVYAWGEVVQVRANYLGFVGISVRVDKQEGMPFTFPGDIAMCTVDTDAEYIPVKGHRVQITVCGPEKGGIVVEKTFRCSRCDGEFPMAWSEAEAEAEVLERFGEIAEEDRCIVCEDCDKLIMSQFN